MSAVRPPVPPMRRYAQVAAGLLLFAVGVVVTPIPGPGGVFFFAAGLVLILRASTRARRTFARAKRRWPRAGHACDRAMRRGSALRRHARDRPER